MKIIYLVEYVYEDKNVFSSLWYRTLNDAIDSVKHKDCVDFRIHTYCFDNALSVKKIDNKILVGWTKNINCL